MQSFQKFRIQNKVAKFEIVLDGYRVVVTVEPQEMDGITEREAEIVLTKAMLSFPPQRTTSE